MEYSMIPRADSPAARTLRLKLSHRILQEALAAYVREHLPGGFPVYAGPLPEYRDGIGTAIVDYAPPGKDNLAEWIGSAELTGRSGALAAFPEAFVTLNMQFPARNINITLPARAGTVRFRSLEQGSHCSLREESFAGQKKSCARVLLGFHADMIAAAFSAPDCAALDLAAATAAETARENFDFAAVERSLTRFFAARMGLEVDREFFRGAIPVSVANGYAFAVTEFAPTTQVGLEFRAALYGKSQDRNALGDVMTRFANRLPCTDTALPGVAYRLLFAGSVSNVVYSRVADAGLRVTEALLELRIFLVPLGNEG